MNTLRPVMYREVMVCSISPHINIYTKNTDNCWGADHSLLGPFLIFFDWEIKRSGGGIVNG